MTQKKRVLSQRTLRARKIHRCDNCEHPIFPGDLYDVVVSIITNGPYKYLYIRKEHVHPYCPDPDDDWREWEELFEDHCELPLAA